MGQHSPAKILFHRLLIFPKFYSARGFTSYLKLESLVVPIAPFFFPVLWDHTFMEKQFILSGYHQSTFNSRSLSLHHLNRSVKDSIWEGKERRKKKSNNFVYSKKPLLNKAQCPHPHTSSFCLSVLWKQEFTAQKPVVIP